MKGWHRRAWHWLRTHLDMSDDDWMTLVTDESPLEPRGIDTPSHAYCPTCESHVTVIIRTAMEEGWLMECTIDHNHWWIKRDDDPE